MQLLISVSYREPDDNDGIVFLIPTLSISQKMPPVVALEIQRSPQISMACTLLSREFLLDYAAQDDPGDCPLIQHTDIPWDFL